MASSLWLLALAGISGVVAHGAPRFVHAEGVKYPVGKTLPSSIGWNRYENSEIWSAFVSGGNYTTPEIICHYSAKNGKEHAPVKAGSTVGFEWENVNHPGPVLTYLANCRGPCETVDKNDLKFFKIQEAGIIQDNNDGYEIAAGFPANNYWASNKMMDDEYVWNVTIPDDIVKGNYVIRHEIPALHFAIEPASAQHYVFCANLEVTGGGSVDPPAIPATQLYNKDDPGLHLDITAENVTKESYVIPGPPLYKSGGASTSQLSADSPSASGNETEEAYTTAEASSKSSPQPSNSKTATTSAVSSSTQSFTTKKATTTAASSSTTSAKPSATKSVDSYGYEAVEPELIASPVKNGTETSTSTEQASLYQTPTKQASEDQAKARKPCHKHSKRQVAGRRGHA